MIASALPTLAMRSTTPSVKRCTSSGLKTSARIAALRDEPDCVREEFSNVGAKNDPGLNIQLSFDPNAAPTILKSRPRVAILREQGVNGQVEMAWAFDAAGFESIDVHMTDVLSGRVQLSERFQGPRRLRRILLRRCARRRTMLGENHSVPRTCA